jgi:outer membrane protein TolC
MYGQTVLNAFNEVDTNLNNEVLLKAQEQDLQTALRASENTLGIMKVKFQVGEVDISPMLQTESAVLAARMTLTGLQLSRLARRINLCLALGGAFDARDGAFDDCGAKADKECPDFTNDWRATVIVKTAPTV